MHKLKLLLTFVLIIFLASCNVASTSGSTSSVSTPSSVASTNVTSIEISSTSALTQFIGLTSKVTVSAVLNQNAANNTTIEWYVDNVKSLTQAGLLFEFFPTEVKTYSVYAKVGNLTSNTLAVTVGLLKFNVTNIQALSSTQLSVRGDAGISFTIPGLTIASTSNYNLANQTYLLNFLTPMVQGTSYNITANKAGFESTTVTYLYETRKLEVSNVLYKGLKVTPNADGAYEIQKPFVGAPSQSYTLSLLQTNLDGNNVPISIITNVPSGATAVAPFQTTLTVQKGVNITKEYTLTNATEPGLYVHNISVNNVILVVRILVSNPTPSLTLTTPFVYNLGVANGGGTPLTNPFAKDAEGDTILDTVEPNSAGQYIITRPYNGKPFELTFVMTADNFPTPLGFPQGSNPYNIIAGLAGPSGGVMYYASTVNTLATTYPFRETTGNAYRITQYVDAKTALGTYTYTFTATGNNINITRTIIVVVRENTPELTPIINYNSEELKPNSDGSYTIIKPLGSNVLTTNIAAKISYYESPLASFTSSGTGVTTLYNVDGLRYLLDTRITYSGPLASITPLVTKIAVQMGAANNNKVDDAATSQTNPQVNYDLYNATGAVREIDLIALRDETTYTTNTNIFDPLKTITSTTFPGIHTFTLQIGALSRTFIFRVVEATPMILVKDDSVKYGPSGAEIAGNVTLNKNDGKYYVDGVGQNIKIDVLPFGMASGSYPYTYIRRTPSGSLLSNTNNVSLLLKPTGSFATYDGTLAFPIAPNPGYEMVVNELLSEEGEYLYSFTINNVLKEIKVVVLAAPELRVETVSINNLPLPNANEVFYIKHASVSRYLEVTLKEFNVENTYKYILNKTGLFPTGANLTSALQDLVIIDGKMTVGITLPAFTAGNEAIPETHTYMVALYKGNVQIGVVSKIVIFSEPNNSTVFFNTNGGTAIEPVTQYVGTKTPTLTTTRAGYSFNSWHLTTALNDATPRTLGSGGNFVLAAADTILYAKWTALEYTVTLNPSGGTTGNGTATVNATSGLSMPTAVRPQTGPSGLTVFQGFFSAASGAGTKYYNADMSSARNWDIHEEDLTVTLFAHWTAN